MKCNLLISSISVKIELMFLWLIVVVCVQNGHHGCSGHVANDANDTTNVQVG
jgi:hypothetical protein